MQDPPRTTASHRGARRFRRLPIAWQLAAFLLTLNAALVVGSGWLVYVDERAHPPIGSFVDIDGLRLHVVQAAPDPPPPGPARPALLLLHGGGTSLLDLSSSLLPALIERGYRVIAIDRPGHGYSQARIGDGSPPRQARLLQAALERLGIVDAVWIGHSRGASVVLAALLSGRPVAGVLLAGVTRPTDRPTPTHQRLLQTPLLGPWFAWTAIEYAGRLAMPIVVQTAFAPETAPPDYRARTGLNLSIRPQAAMQDARERRAVNAWLRSAGAGLARIDRPLIAVHGERDALVPASRHLAAVKGALPSMSVVTLPGAGHGLLHTRTDQVADAIVEALASLE